MLTPPWWVARPRGQSAGTIVFLPTTVLEFVLAPRRSSACSGSRCPALLTDVGVLCRLELHHYAQARRGFRLCEGDVFQGARYEVCLCCNSARSHRVITV